MTNRLLVLSLAALTIGCGAGVPSPSERAAIATEIERQVKGAYDLKSPDVVKSFQQLYPDSGRVIYASAGQVITSRDTILRGIADFWRYVGSNMKDPVWMWDSFNVDVLSRDAAVMTTTYHVPHTTPSGRPHVIGGAWTAVFRRDGGRWVIVQEHLSDLPPAVADSAHANMQHETRPPD
jgi:ketosteroid isomerase-like protein